MNGRSSFRSLRNPPKRLHEMSQLELLDLAKVLFEEHRQRREVAMQAANLVCGNCGGSGNTASTLMPGEFVACFACTGSGKPNETITAVPAFTPEDHEQMYKIGRVLKLLEPAGRVEMVTIIRQHFPQMYDEPTGQPS